MNNKTVCVLPFNTLSIGSSGDLRVCCNYTADPAVPIPKRSYVQKITSLDWQHTPEVAAVRAGLSNGIKMKECSRCWTLEASGATSYRQMSNEFKSPDRYQRLLSGDTSVSLERIEIDLGNKCNLACRMCHPASSSLLAEELVRNPDGAYTDGAQFLNNPLWVNNSNFFDVIRANKDTLNHIYIIGGEPLIIEEQEQILDLLIELGVAKNVSLEYSTNVTTIGSKWYSKWENFKSVNLNLSVDGTGEYYEYVRWPAKWNKIQNNLLELKEWARHNNVRTSIHSTLSNLTIPNLGNALDTFITELGFDVFYINVDSPDFLSPWVLPISVRNTMAIDLLNKIKSAPYANVNGIQNICTTLEKVAASPEPDNKTKTAFIRKMQYMDKCRKQNLLDLHPWFNEWI